MTLSFNTWNEYYKFLSDCLKSDYISDTYLVYKIYNDLYRYADIKMVNYLLEIGLDPQEGFNKFFHVLLDGYKNAHLMKDDLPTPLCPLTKVVLSTNKFLITSSPFSFSMLIKNTW